MMSGHGQSARLECPHGPAPAGGRRRRFARQRNVGTVYVTDQGPATAYQQIVTGAYWQAELAAVQAP